MDSFVSSVPLLVACTILPAPHAVYALRFVVHQHGSDRAAIEADSFEHAAIKTHELGLYPAQVTRKESKEFSAEDQPDSDATRPMATSPLFCQSVRRS